MGLFDNKKNTEYLQPYNQHSLSHLFCQHNIVFLGLFVIYHLVIAILSGT